MILVPLFLACEPAPAGVRPTSADERLRIAVETTPPAAIPECDLLLPCPQLGVSPSACVDDPALFTVLMFGDAVVSVELDPDGPPLQPGSWFAAFPDPQGGCELTLFSFTVEE